MSPHQPNSQQSRDALAVEQGLGDNRWLRRLPGFARTSAGLEWRIWTLLPRLTWWGSLLLGLPCAFLGVSLYPDVLGQGLQHSLWPELTALQGQAARQAMQWLFAGIGLLIFYWTAVLTVAIGCLIVMAMKGPAYVADGLSLPAAPPDAPKDDYMRR